MIAGSCTGQNEDHINVFAKLFSLKESVASNTIKTVVATNA
jgi:viroplasmin and RNaseH domain-containing protein